MSTLKELLLAITALCKLATEALGMWRDNEEKRDEDKLQYLLDHPTADNLAESYVVSQRIERRRAKSVGPV